MYKAALVLAFVAVASAGNVAYLDHHIGATAEQTVRGFGGQSSLSHQSKTVNGAYSTSSAYKTKATNNAVFAAPAFAAPAYAAPAYAAPAYAAPAYAHPAIAAPAYAAAPAVAAAPIGSHIAYGYTPLATSLLG